MRSPHEDIELQTHSRFKVLRMTEISKGGDFYDCQLAVRSGGFACERKFYFDDNTLYPAIEALLQMDEKLKGTARIQGTYEQDWIEFECSSQGHVKVSGEIYEHSDLSQFLRFAFITDQTVLKPLVKAFERLRDA